MPPTSCLRALTVVGVAAALVVTGTAAADAAPAHSRPTVDIHTTRHHHVAAPSKIAPGLVRLRNTGKHPIMVVGSRGHSVTTLVEDLDANGPSRFLKQFTMRDLIPAHSDAYLRLGHARYYLVDAAASIETARVRTMTVAGRTRNATLPAAARIGIDGHRALHAPRQLDSHNYLGLDNDSGTLQDITLYAIGSHTSDAQLAAFAAKPSMTKLFRLDLRRAYLAGMLGPHHAAWVDLHLRPGRYVMYNETVSANPHLARMSASHLRVVTVS